MFVSLEQREVGRKKSCDYGGIAWAGAKAAGIGGRRKSSDQWGKTIISLKFTALFAIFTLNFRIFAEQGLKKFTGWATAFRH